MTEHTITLEPRRNSNGSAMRGDRMIVVNGEAWGFTSMRGHGCHGNTHHFHDLSDRAIVELREVSSGRPPYPYEVYVKSRGERELWRKEPDLRSTEQRIIDKARELIAAGLLVSAAEQHRLETEAALRWNAARKAEADHEARIREGLLSLWRHNSLSDDERWALAQAWRKVFHSEIDEA